MKKADRLTEIFDSCADSLFSALMSSGIQRAEGIDRTAELFKALSDRMVMPKSAAAAYRLMAKRAARKGWAPGEPDDRFSLTGGEHRRIMKKLLEYLASGGRKGRIRKKVISAAAVLTVLAVGVFFIVRQAVSEEYLSRLTEYYIMIGTVSSSEEEIIFSLQLRKGQEPLMLTHLPTLILTDESGERTFTAKPDRELVHDPIDPDPRSLCDEEYRELRITSKDYGSSFPPGHYKAVFDLCSSGDETLTPTATVTKELEV